MHLFRRSLGLGALLLITGAVACSSGSIDESTPGGEQSNAPSPDAQDVEVSPEELESVGQFEVTFDPSGGLKFRQLTGEDSSAKPRGPTFETQTTAARGAGDTVLNGSGATVNLTGPGVWNAAKQNLEATVVITHNGARDTDLDEPQLYVVSISDPTVTFVTTDSTSNAAGAVLAFADVQRPGASNLCGTGAFAGVKTSASRFMSIHDPTPDTGFTLVVDVRARTGTGALSRISPDCDGDGFNAEDQDAGRDCAIFDPNLYGSGITEVADRPCTVCDNACSGSCDLAAGVLTSSFICGADVSCVCTLDSDLDDTAVTCRQDCDVTCNGNADGPDSGNNACRLLCRNGADCDLGCSDTVSGVCFQQCDEATTCIQACSGDSADGCFSACTGASTCNTTCSGTSSTAGSTCGVDYCRNGSTCDVTCGTGTEQADYPGGCGVRRCESNSSCTVTCADTSNTCSMTCDRTAAACTLDCSALPQAEWGKCVLTCERPRVVTPVLDGGGNPTGVFTCQ